MFDQILGLVAQPPGSLVYHFIVLFAVEAAFGIAVGQWMRKPDTTTARLTIGIGVVLLGRILLLLAALAVFIGYLPRNILLPPIERTADTLTLLALAWAFYTMDYPRLLNRNFIPDTIAGVLAGVVLAGAGGSFYYWFTSASTGALFNGSWLDIIWSGAQMVFAVVGVVGLLVRFRLAYDAFLKGLVLLLLGAAAAVQIIDPPLGDIALAVRIGQIIVMPMLAAVAFRHVVERLLHWDRFEPQQWNQDIIEGRTPSGVPRPALGEFAPPPAASIPQNAQARPEPVPIDQVPPPYLAEPTRRAATVPEDVGPDDDVFPTPPPDDDVIDMMAEEIPLEVLEDSGSEVRLVTDTALYQPVQASDPDVLDVVEAISLMLSTLEEREIAQEVPRAIASALRADMSVLVVVGEDMQDAGIIGGYDNIAQDYLPLAVLNLRKHPTIVESLDRLRQMRLSTQRNKREVRDIYDKLGISHIGPIYLQPLVNSDDRFGLLLVGSPYSGRNLSTKERNLFDRLGPLVAALMVNIERHQDLKLALRDKENINADQLTLLEDAATAARAELNAARAQMAEMKAYIRDLHRQLQSIPEEPTLSQGEADALRAEIAALEESLARKQAEVDELRAIAENAGIQQETLASVQQQVVQYRRQLELLEKTPSLAAPAVDELLVVNEAHQAFEKAAKTEIASLRVRLAEAEVSQQETAMIQEQLANRAREIIQLNTRLAEAEALSEALTEQINGKGGSGGLGVLQAQLKAQKSEIKLLTAELNDALALAELTPADIEARQKAERVDQEALVALEAQLAERSALIDKLQMQLQERSESIAILKSHMSSVDKSLSGLRKQLEFKTEEVEQLQESLAETRQRARDRITELQAQLDGNDPVDGVQVNEAYTRALEAELAEKAASVNLMEEQLNNARFAITQLEERLSQTNDAVSEAIAEAGQGDSHNEVIASIAQELRTPMSSIMGYTELLLKEAFGILGGYQRNFLQKVKANTERMGALLDDLIRITTEELDNLELRLQSLEVIPTIDEAVLRVANQFREKGLILRFALAENLPEIVTDRELLLQALGHLLSNAALASPIKGEVQLTVSGQFDEVPNTNAEMVETHVLHISVEDAGGGVSSDDIERVFTRQYRAEHPLIEGLGDTGVSLAMSKTMIDLLGGRIWAETQPDIGTTTFHVVLPFEPILEAHDEA